MNKKELLKALQTVSPFLEDSNSSYIFTGTDVAVMDEISCIQYPFETDFKCTVKSKEFLHVLSKTDEEEVELKLEDNQIILESKNTKLKMNVDKKIDIMVYARIDQINSGTEDVEFEILPENFNEGVNICSFSVSNLSSMKSCQYIYIDGNEIYSGDGDRCSKFTMNESMDKSFLLEPKIARLLKKFDIIEYYITDSCIHFLNENNIIISVNCIKADYPKETLNNLLNLKDGEEIPLEKSLINIVEVGSAMSDLGDGSRTVLISMDNQYIYCESKSELGTVTKKGKTSYKGRAIEFMVNPEFLIEAVKKTNVMHLNENSLTLKTDNFIHTVGLKI